MTAPLHLCLVDDSADFRFLIQELVKQLWPAWPLSLFESGQDLLQRLPSLSPPPDLILLDQHMLDLDGQQTLEAIKQQPVLRSIPVVLMSADASGSEIKRGYEAGARAFLIKPLEYGSLTNRLVEAVHYAKCISS